MLKRKIKVNERQTGRETAQMGISFRRIALASALGIAVLLTVLMAASLLISWGVVSAQNMYICIIFALAAAGVACAIAAAGNRKRLLSALLACGLLLAMLVAGGAVLFEGVFLVKNFLLVLIILLISCMMGSVISTAIR